MSRRLLLVLLSPLLALVWLANLAWLVAAALHVGAHLVAARLLGIPIASVSLGVGPAVWTSGAWQLAPLPGAFVRPLLDDVRAPQVAAYLAAGPIGSLATAWVLVFLALAVQGVSGIEVEQPLADEVRTIGEVFPQSPAEDAGLRVGDELVAVGGEPVQAWSEVPARLAPGPQAVRVLREGQPVDVEVTPLDYEGRLVLGIARPRGPVAIEHPSPAEAAGRASRFVGGFFSGIATLFRGGPTALGGPVAILGRPGPPNAPSWLLVGAFVVATRALLLSVYNVLPLPFSDALAGLDQGSRRLRGRPLRLKAWNVAVGAMLLALFVFIAAVDVLRFVAG